MPRSPRLLVLAGLLGLLFFWATDPRVGLTARLNGEGARDVANQSRVGTIVGATGSAAVLLVGAWLVTRRAT
jgi:hypothetical protein